MTWREFSTLLRGLTPESVTAIGHQADARAKAKRPPQMGDPDLITDPDEVAETMRRMLGG